jgi:DNA-binding MarR family transcriptional regulator
MSEQVCTPPIRGDVFGSCPTCGHYLESPPKHKKPLTAKQATVLGLIKDHIVSKGYAPSLQELADHCDNALSTTWALVDALVQKGHINKSDRDWRSMDLVP